MAERRVMKIALTRAALTLVAVASVATSVAGQKDPVGSISGATARAHIGSRVTVCGLVASARYVANADEQPPFLNIDRAYPDQTLVVVIPGFLQQDFGRPEQTLLEARVCATGVVEELPQPAGLLCIVLERSEDLVVGEGSAKEGWE